MPCSVLTPSLTTQSALKSKTWGMSSRVVLDLVVRLLLRWRDRVRVLQLEQHQRQAVDEDEDVRPAVVPAADRQLVDGQEDVVLRDAPSRRRRRARSCAAVRPLDPHLERRSASRGRPCCAGPCRRRRVVRRDGRPRRWTRPAGVNSASSGAHGESCGTRPLSRTRGVSRRSPRRWRACTPAPAAAPASSARTRSPCPSRPPCQSAAPTAFFGRFDGQLAREEWTEERVSKLGERAGFQPVVII